MPTLEEINAAAPDTPVFVLHLYDRALAERRRAARGRLHEGHARPAGRRDRARQERQSHRPADRPPERVRSSTRRSPRARSSPRRSAQLDAPLHARAEPARRDERHRRGRRLPELPGRLQGHRGAGAAGPAHRRASPTTSSRSGPKGELDDFQRWTAMVTPGQGDDFFRLNGAGEMLVFSAADFEDFLEPRPDLPPRDGAGPRGRRDATWRRAAGRSACTPPTTRSITRALDVFESVNRDVPFAGLRWFFDHAETISPRNIERVEGARRRHRDPAPHGVPGRVLRRALRRQGGRERAAHRAHARDGRSGRRGHRRDARRQLQPVRLPLLARHGQDARRHAALRRGEPPRPDGGAAPVDGRERVVLGRGRQEGQRSRRASSPTSPCSRPTTSRCPRSRIKGLESVLTIVGGKVVHAAQEFGSLAPPSLPVVPSWTRGAADAAPGAHAGHTHRSRLVGCSCFPA